MVNTLKHEICLDKKFSIVFYLIQDSMYSLPNNPPPPNNPNHITSYSLPAIVNLLNTAFSPICVSFEHCKTVIIPDYNHNTWKAFGNGAMITSTWYTENTINVYIPAVIDPTFFDPIEKAYAYSPPTGTVAPRNAIVFDKNAITRINEAGFQGAEILHAFGIFFGLPHTYDEINPSLPVSPMPPTNVTPSITTLEFADHANSFSNCAIHGDGFCDTEADPFPASLSPASPIPLGSGDCSSGAGMVDGYGTHYLLPTDNFMSHYPCRCRFSTEQYNYMAQIMMTKRKYLH